ncbi:Decapping and exoribonuclease protein [Anthophora retusa]
MVSVKSLNGPVHEISNLEIVGGYSVDGRRQYRNDLSQLKYYRGPQHSRKIYMDLNKDKYTRIEKLPESLKLDFVLKWILENLDRLKVDDSQNSVRWLDPEFICIRGVLKELLFTPFTNKDWIICASKYKGTIYLCNYDTEQKIMDNLYATAYQKDCSIWGLKFEQYLVANTPHEDPDLSVPLNENEEFCCIFKAKFGTISLLYAAEMDGICSQEIVQDTIVGKNVQFVEMKTLYFKKLKNCKLIEENKKLLWWAQIYPVGIQSIICGLRNMNGIIKRVEKIDFQRSSDDIKVMEDRSKSFCSAFLKYIKEIVVEEHDRCVYKFTYNSRSLSIKVEVIKSDPKSEYTFLHQWYTKTLKQHI